MTASAMEFPAQITFCGVDLGVAASHEEGVELLLRYQQACIREGMCPVHHARLDVKPPGLCRPCNKVWHATDTEVRWDLATLPDAFYEPPL